jgi:hypothetical protein
MAARGLGGLLLAAWSCAAAPAQESTVLSGAWEACRTGDFVEHFFVELGEDGRFSRVVLRDDPQLPVAADQGAYEVEGGVLILRYAAEVGGVLAAQAERVLVRLSATGDTLYWGEGPEVALHRAGHLGEELYGQWGILNFADGQIAGQISLRRDGTYDLDLGGAQQSGLFAMAGSGVVHWPTTADRPEVVGVPAVWTRVRVEGDRLFYDIACTFTIEAVRLAPTAARPMSWGALKRDRR